MRKCTDSEWVPVLPAQQEDLVRFDTTDDLPQQPPATPPVIPSVKTLLLYDQQTPEQQAKIDVLIAELNVHIRKKEQSNESLKVGVLKTCIATLKGTKSYKELREIHKYMKLDRRYQTTGVTGLFGMVGDTEALVQKTLAHVLWMEGNVVAAQRVKSRQSSSSSFRI